MGKDLWKDPVRKKTTDKKKKGRTYTEWGKRKSVALNRKKERIEREREVKRQNSRLNKRKCKE